jgi:zinc D-Ala-D-Ala carboxypeptidase
MRIKLSDNFYLDEFTRSQTAARFGIDNSIKIGSMEYLNVVRLCRDVLQPIRNALGPVYISSGYRCAQLNKKMDGAANSQHTKGEAADITVTDHTPLQVANWCAANLTNYDQIIHEFGEWVHVSVPRNLNTPRLQTLTAIKVPRAIGKPKTVYIDGILSVDMAAAWNRLNK